MKRTFFCFSVGIYAASFFSMQQFIFCCVIPSSCNWWYFVKWAFSLCPGCLGLDVSLPWENVVGYGALSLCNPTASPVIRVSQLFWVSLLVSSRKHDGRVLLREEAVVFVSLGNGIASQPTAVSSLLFFSVTRISHSVYLPLSICLSCSQCCR